MIYNDSKTRSKNRKKLVEVAKRLFMENGIAHTTVMDIVRNAEMERKTFYNYFEDKEEIADYIFYQSMKVFYGEGFSDDDYTDCKNGYDKIEKYLTTVVNHYIKYSHEMLFLVHYDYYFQKEPSEEVINAIYDNSQISRKGVYFVEGVEDGSINIRGKDPKAMFFVIQQAIGSYASRLIFRGYKNGVMNVDINFDSLYDILDLHLDYIKK